MDISMNQFNTVWISAVVGLFAGVGHAVVSHHADLPLSLFDQATQLFDTESESQYF